MRTPNKAAQRPSARVLHGVTAALLLLLALNAVGGGLYGMLGAKGVPMSWLEGSPFRSYLIPSMFLFFVVGGSCILAASMLLRHSEYARMAVLWCGVLLVTWIFLQLSVIGFVSWLQPAVFVAAIALIALSEVVAQQREVNT